MASSESHNSMIDWNEVRLDMESIMGQMVPKRKASVSQDSQSVMGHTVLMTQHDDDISDSAWKEAFRQRLKEARGKRSQEDMASLLCISRDAYSKYEGGRASQMPTRLLPKFCKICAVSLEWLIEGDKEAKVAKQPAKQPKTARQR